MKAHEIFQNLDEDRACDILHDLRDEEPQGFRSIQASMAQRKNLRPVFVQKKSRDGQAQWMVKTVRAKNFDEVAEHLLQVWLLTSHKEMLTTFLDAMEIEHDGEGSVENLPTDLEAAKLKVAVENLLGKFPESDVAIYLHVFQLQQETGWPALGELLESDERLKLGE